MPFPLLTFYKFLRIADPEGLAVAVRSMLKNRGALGTVLLSHEGVNGSVSAGARDLDEIEGKFSQPEFFGPLTVKRHIAKTQPFRKLHIAVKPEIITFKEPTVDPLAAPAGRVSPEEFAEWLRAGREDLLVIDTRNQFEIGFGKFSGALELGLKSFTDFANAAKKLPEDLKKKTVVTYCTGGIRCEKAAPYLANLGFQNVLQLDGGILNYFARVGGEHWDGDCFVFDNRVAVDASLEETNSSLCCRCQRAIRDPLVKQNFSETERFCEECEGTK